MRSVEMSADFAVVSAIDMYRSKSHGAQIEVQELIRQWLTDAGDELDGFHRAEAAGDAGDGAEDGKAPLP